VAAPRRPADQPPDPQFHDQALRRVDPVAAPVETTLTGFLYCGNGPARLTALTVGLDHRLCARAKILTVPREAGVDGEREVARAAEPVWLASLQTAMGGG
jgi:hypothetical protein